MDEQEALDFINDTIMNLGPEFANDVTGWYKGADTMDLLKYVYSYQLLKDSALIDTSFMGDDYLRILEELVVRAKDGF